MRDELNHLEQRWGLAIQSASFGVWDLDITSETVHYSPQWKGMLGYGDADEFDSTSVWRSRVHPDDLQPMLTSLHAHLSGTRPAYEVEFRLRASDGTYRWMLSRGQVAARDASGKALRAVGTLTDITDRREADRLRLERDRALAASAAASEFLSRMSHELRTPLNAVLGFAQLLAGRLGDGNLAQQREFIGYIEDAGWRLLQMIDEVLHLSDIEAGRLRVDLEQVPLAPVVRDAIDAVIPMALRNEVDVAAPSLPADAVVLADRGRLCAVLQQLLGNAVKFNRPGGTVRVHAVAAAGGWQVAVVDDGIGIPQAQMPHLFEPFNRQGRRQNATEGVGVGLVLVRALLHMMGGSVEAQSVEGRGSTFTVVLPAAVPPPAGGD